jgi:hypothetical protein
MAGIEFKITVPAYIVTHISPVFAIAKDEPRFSFAMGEIDYSFKTEPAPVSG